MLFRPIITLILAAATLSGCIVAGNSVAPVSNWPAAPTAQPISFELKTTLVRRSKGIETEDTGVAYLIQKRYTPLLQEVVPKALTDSRQFSQVIDHRSEQTPYHVELTFKWITAADSETDWLIILPALTLGLVPGPIPGARLELEAIYHNRLTAKTFAAHQIETSRTWVGLLPLFWQASSDRQAHTDMAYRLMQATLDEARQSGFFATAPADGNDKFF